MNRRNTIQRDLVLHLAVALDHPTADEIYHAVRRQHPSISRATVYRNLTLLTEQGRLRKVAVPTGADHYDATLTGHYHVCCRRCGKVADVALPYMRELIDRVPLTHGYLIEDHELVLRGLCPACRAQEQPQWSMPVTAASGEYDKTRENRR